MNKVKPTGTIKVIENYQCDLKALVESLQDLLSDLHYETFSCRACGWIEHKPDDQPRCWRCYGRFCTGCINYIGTADSYICEVCDEECKEVDRGDDETSSSSESTSASADKKRKIDIAVVSTNLEK